MWLIFIEIHRLCLSSSSSLILQQSFFVGLFMVRSRLVFYFFPLDLLLVWVCHQVFGASLFGKSSSSSGFYFYKLSIFSFYSSIILDSIDFSLLFFVFLHIHHAFVHIQHQQPDSDSDFILKVHPSEGSNSVILILTPKLNISNYLAWSLTMQRALGAEKARLYQRFYSNSMLIGFESRCMGKV